MEVDCAVVVAIHSERKQQQVKKRQRNYRKNYERNFAHCGVETCTEKRKTKKFLFLLEIAIGIVKFYGIFMTFLSPFFFSQRREKGKSMQLIVWRMKLDGAIMLQLFVYAFSMNLFDFKLFVSV